MTLRTIAEHTWSNGDPPSVRELGRRLWLPYSTTHLRLRKLAQLGFIQRDNEPRGIWLTEKGLATLAWSPPLFLTFGNERI